MIQFVSISKDSKGHSSFSPEVHLNPVLKQNEANVNISDAHTMKIPKPKRYYFYPTHMEWHARGKESEGAPGHKIPL